MTFELVDPVCNIFIYDTILPTCIIILQRYIIINNNIVVTFQWILWFLIIFQLLSFVVAYQWNEKIENTSLIIDGLKTVSTYRRTEIGYRIGYYPKCCMVKGVVGFQVATVVN